MGACSEVGWQVGTLASQLIDGTPRGYVTIGGEYADIGPSFSHYDDLPVGEITGSYADFSTALNSLAIAGQGSSNLIADAITVQPNHVFANMDRIVVDIDNWRGDSATNFQENYQAQLPYVADSNFTGVAVAVAALEAQAELYAAAEASILDIGHKTLSALEAADGRGDAVGSFALTVLAAVGTVTVTVLTGGTAIPIIIAVASGAASVGASATSRDFSAESPEQVMSAFYQAVGEVESFVGARQQVIGDGLREFAAAVRSDIDRTSFEETEYPRFKFKPTGFAQGPGGLGDQLVQLARLLFAARTREYYRLMEEHMQPNPVALRRVRERFEEAVEDRPARGSAAGGAVEVSTVGMRHFAVHLAPGTGARLGSAGLAQALTAAANEMVGAWLQVLAEHKREKWT